MKPDSGWREATKRRKGQKKGKETKGREGDTIVAKVDLCNLMQCDGDPKQYIREDKYICAKAEVRNLYRPVGRGMSNILRCPTWNFVVANTGPLDWGYYPTSPQQNRLTIVKGYSDPQDCTSNSCNPLLITLKDAKISDNGLYSIGVDVRGSDPIGAFRIKVTEAGKNPPPLNTDHSTEAPPVNTGVSYLENLTIRDVMALETGYTDKNEWLEWMTFTAQQSNVSNCIVCSTARPQLGTETVDITNDNGDYSATWFVNQTVSRADIWWLCGDGQLRPRLPSLWRGSCALVQLLMPFHIFSLREYRELGEKLLSASHLHRETRSTGVPDEFKARNQIAAGFKSFLSWWVTVNKNVDWINYLYYNQQCFVNHTRDAIRGIAEQLGPTSLMSWQNRMALHMLLAEKGGVCNMFGTFCCTSIPNNTSPDGSITKALEGLTALSKELAVNSGINNPFANLLESWFGKWSGLIASGLISLSVAAALLVVCGWCWIPCPRWKRTRGPLRTGPWV
uniref:Uncharacterized protein n=1 Tax=Monopterus albus TaxID=43700 RepID=A0A3Q3IGE7_MONAL